MANINILTSATFLCIQATSERRLSIAETGECDDGFDTLLSALGFGRWQSGTVVMVLISKCCYFVFFLIFIIVEHLSPGPRSFYSLSHTYRHKFLRLSSRMSPTESIDYKGSAFYDSRQVLLSRRPAPQELCHPLARMDWHVWRHSSLPWPGTHGRLHPSEITDMLASEATGLRFVGFSQTVFLNAQYKTYQSSGDVSTDCKIIFPDGFGPFHH